MEELLRELKEAKAKIAEIEKKIEEKQEKEKSGRWKPQKGGTYWCVSDTGRIYHSEWDNDIVDNERYTIGNCYQTREEAEFYREKLEVIAELKEFEEPKDRKWDGIISHYFFYYDYDEEEIDISYNDYYKSTIYFESEEKAQQAIDAVGEERVAKYLLGVDLNE